MISLSNTKASVESLGQNPLLLVLWLTLSVISGVAVVFLTPQNVLLAIMIFLLIAVPLYRYTQNQDPFDILQMVSLGFVFYYLGGGLFLQIIGTGWSTLDLTLVYLGVILGYMAFCGAYYSGFGATLVRQLRLPQVQDINQRRFIRFACLLSVISIPIGLYLGANEASLSPTVAGLLRNMGHFSKLASLLFLANYILKPNPRSLIYLLVALVIAFWYEFFIFEAERRTVLRWMITMLVYWHYQRRRFKLRTLIVLAILGLVSLFALKIVSGLYHYPRDLWSINLFQDSLNRYLSRYDNLFIGIARSFESPIAVENFALVIEGVRSGKTDLLWGDSYLRFLMVFIPREIWPDKPLHIGRQIPLLVQSSSDAGALPVTMLGEMYFNFGYMGILVNMLVLGILYNFFYCLLMRSKKGSLRSVPAALIYAVTIGFALEYFRGGFHMIVLQYVFFNILPLLVGIFYFSKFSNSPMDGGSVVGNCNR